MDNGNITNNSKVSNYELIVCEPHGWWYSDSFNSKHSLLIRLASFNKIDNSIVYIFTKYSPILVGTTYVPIRMNNFLVITY